MNIRNIKNIIFDFDGVIIDSMDIRADGVTEVFRNYDINVVDEFVKYYKYNAGLSKFEKIRYFYNEMLSEEISEEKINYYSEKLTSIMRKKLTNKEILIKDTLIFIINNYKYYNFHIASGSEEKELLFLCDKLGISEYFKSIKGSPIHKNNLVKSIIKENRYYLDETILIGDSINDFEAANINNIYFAGFNNENLSSYGELYIRSFKEFI